MNHWFTQADAPIVSTFVKRFDPMHWTIDFPRGTAASVVTAADGHGVTVTSEYLRLGDLVGLIYESEDRHAHPAHARETSRDYSGCKLSFHWASSGMLPLDAINGPTLTIEGRDAEGVARSWYVRLWNYAAGTPTAADVSLDFDALDGGFLLPSEAVRVDQRDIDRMFISLVPADYLPNSSSVRAAPAVASVSLTDIRCDGPASVLDLNDAVVPEHGLRIATAYDDMYHLPPERIVRSVERLGYRGVINHYIGMSHFFALGGAAKLDPERSFNAASLAWHRAFASAAKANGYEVIWSVSYEILDMFCPEAWKQRAFDGTPAATGYDPPSTLLSPANGAAIDYLCEVARRLVAIALEAGLNPQVQIGEPWWWVDRSGRICLYDSAARAALGGDPVEISDVRAALNGAQTSLLDAAGVLLSSSTAAIASAVKAEHASAKTLLLAYLPGPLDPNAPELRRANLPVGWAKPAFDVLQVEDYEWVTGGQRSVRLAAYETVSARLGYLPEEQHYLSGFVASAEQRSHWREIIGAAVQAQNRGCAEVFVWALPQVLRDGLTIFGKEAEMTPFEDVMFPIEIGSEASVSPTFSTNIVTSASGHESRNANWAHALLRFDAGPGVRGESELLELIAFFRARRGPAVAFRFRDPFDSSSNELNGAPSATDQQVGIGDGATTTFALAKRYSVGEERRITRPVSGSVRVAVDGVEVASGWTLEPLGRVVFASPPADDALITAGFQFDVPVRFADDRIEINRATFLAGEAPSVPLIEVREL